MRIEAGNCVPSVSAGVMRIDEEYAIVDLMRRFDDNGAPLIALLRKIIGIDSDEVKTYLKSRLIPSEK